MPRAAISSPAPITTAASARRGQNASAVPADPTAEPLGLVELPVGEWRVWVFVHGGADAPPLAETLSEMDTEVAPYEPERLVTAERHEYRVEANWKVVAENYNECYHCGLLHPELCRVSPPRSGAPFEGSGLDNWVGGWMELRDGAATMFLNGASGGLPLRGIDGPRTRRVGYIALLPNLLISLHPDYVMTHRLTPLGPGVTHVECAWLFAPEAVAESDFAPSYARDFWELSNRQDWSACESVQRGLATPGYTPGPLCEDEADVYEFVALMARRYLGT
ncbi:RHO alpha subunit C-terminal catalytic domain-containing protein [Streptomyces lutosisoli]|uniref:RHO alpha subunit C-terminal catalytic domain-containing protein n=1 Tax=Streptomyces lutosisoli TaxID=2665721 RepID=A0ABW2VZ95_9ACTN